MGRVVFTRAPVCPQPAVGGWTPSLSPRGPSFTRKAPVSAPRSHSASRPRNWCVQSISQSHCILPQIRLQKTWAHFFAQLGGGALGGSWPAPPVRDPPTRNQRYASGALPPPWQCPPPPQGTTPSRTSRAAAVRRAPPRERCPPLREASLVFGWKESGIPKPGLVFTIHSLLQSEKILLKIVQDK